MNNIKQSQNSISEVEAVFKIVFRNLQPHNYARLLSEAQPVILREAEILLSCSQLSTSKKQLLLESLKLLSIRNYPMPFKLSHELQTEKSNSHSIEVGYFHSITPMGDEENRAIGSYSGDQRS